ncbi:MAG: HAMP domain-containing histidine kinase [Holophagaceae bacterium]|nr:HAMP domain-containing histidine kinase [Holophagaceae bacterium]
MKRLLRPWALFALCLALGLGAMGWITHIALKTEKAEAETQRKTMLDERVRLSLWFMDSTFALFLNPESSRPYFHYNAFHPAEGAYNRKLVQMGSGDILIPSPMLFMDDPLVLLRFQIDQDNRFTSPVVPEPSMRKLAERLSPDPNRMAAGEARLDEIRHRLSRGSVLKSMVQKSDVLLPREQIKILQAQPGRSRINSAPPAPSSEKTQRLSSGVHLLSPYMVYEGAWIPFWQDQSLFLARQVWVGDREFLQCCWLDWPAVKELLLGTARDLLPSLDLAPVLPGAPSGKDRTLSSLPVRIVPGTIRLPGADHRPARAALIFGWCCLLIGGLAGALVLRHAVRLSESRGAFASAVTHELRSPLTTFRLYTELLAHNMVPEEEKPSLLKTLLSETDRLDHLVKNVLAFARLESRRGANLEPVLVSDLLDRPLARLQERALQSGMELVPDLPQDLAQQTVHTDPLLVEQILLNLVDNACKYASKSVDPRIHLDVIREEGELHFRIRDHGPGIADQDCRHLFQAFHKSAQKAARSAPGVGLGLALCRRLARSLGGDLTHDAASAGATFLLHLPMKSN